MNIARLALRLVGTSRAEQRELLEASSSRITTAQAERARRAAQEARTAAWDTVTGSRHASLLAEYDPGRHRPHRDEDLQQRAEQQRRLREQHERSHRHEPPSQNHSGPSLGM